MHNRIKQVRKDAGLSQLDFAKRLGFESRGAITNIEAGKDIKPNLVNLICKEFGIRENWLRTGEGTMYEDNSEAVRLTRWAAETIADGDPYKLRMLDIMSRMSPEQWGALVEMAKYLAGAEEE